MLNCSAINDVEFHFRQPKPPSSECAVRICEVFYPVESIMISSNCEMGIFKEWSKQHNCPYNDDEFLVSCVICALSVC